MERIRRNIELRTTRKCPQQQPFWSFAQLVIRICLVIDASAAGALRKQEAIEAAPWSSLLKHVAKRFAKSEWTEPQGRRSPPFSAKNKAGFRGMTTEACQMKIRAMKLSGIKIESRQAGK